MPKKDLTLLPKLLVIGLVSLAIVLNLISLTKKIPLIERPTGTNIEKEQGAFSSATGEINPTDKPAVKPTPTIVDPKKAVTVRVTFYGWVDNDPPGKIIAYPKHKNPNSLHEQAGGVGSYADPVTLAAKKDQWPVGTKFYLPYLKKYGIIEDICGNCEDKHLDVWMESNGNFPEKLLDCESKWTKRREVVEIDPPSTHLVDINPFYNLQTGNCR
jgi:3D (Asp-Asp-Asp) domain-containing protein